MHSKDRATGRRKGKERARAAFRGQGDGTPEEKRKEGETEKGRTRASAGAARERFCRHARLQIYAHSYASVIGQRVRKSEYECKYDHRACPAARVLRRSQTQQMSEARARVPARGLTIHI